MFLCVCILWCLIGRSVSSYSISSFSQVLLVNHLVASSYCPLLQKSGVGLLTLHCSTFSSTIICLSLLGFLHPPLSLASYKQINSGALKACSVLTDLNPCLLSSHAPPSSLHYFVRMYLPPMFKCLPSSRRNSPAFHLRGAILSQPNSSTNKAP